MPFACPILRGKRLLLVLDFLALAARRVFFVENFFVLRERAAEVVHKIFLLLHADCRRALHRREHGFGSFERRLRLVNPRHFGDLRAAFDKVSLFHEERFDNGCAPVGRRRSELCNALCWRDPAHAGDGVKRGFGKCGHSRKRHRQNKKRFFHKGKISFPFSFYNT